MQLGPQRGRRAASEEPAALGVCVCEIESSYVCVGLCVSVCGREWVCVSIARYVSVCV